VYSLVGVAFSATPAKSANELSPDGIYPQGRKLAFAGYSGDPARDLANGFTLAGPVYGDQRPYLERCFANDWPVVAQVGPRITFNDKDPAKYKVDPASLKSLRINSEEAFGVLFKRARGGGRTSYLWRRG
jgi:hypothetical protein